MGCFGCCPHEAHQKKQSMGLEMAIPTPSKLADDDSARTRHASIYDCLRGKFDLGLAIDVSTTGECERNLWDAGGLWVAGR